MAPHGSFGPIANDLMTVYACARLVTHHPPRPMPSTAVMQRPPAGSVWLDAQDRVVFGDNFIYSVQDLVDAVERDRSHLKRVADVSAAIKHLCARVDQAMAPVLDRLHSIHVCRQGTTMQVVVETRTAEYDDEVAGLLIDLDIALAVDAEMQGIRVETIALPCSDDGSREGFTGSDWRLTRTIANA